MTRSEEKKEEGEMEGRWEGRRLKEGFVVDAKPKRGIQNVEKYRRVQTLCHENWPTSCSRVFGLVCPIAKCFNCESASRRRWHLCQAKIVCKSALGQSGNMHKKRRRTTTVSHTHWQANCVRPEPTGAQKHQDRLPLGAKQPRTKPRHALTALHTIPPSLSQLRCLPPSIA